MNKTITAEVEGSRALRKTTFPSLNMFYSSSEFSHLAADKTKKLLYTKKKKKRNYSNSLFIFYERKP